MTHYESTIEVERPVRDVYDAWTQFESFPHFMEHVEQVQQLDDGHLHWKAKIAGQEHEWDAEIVQQTPDEIIAWRSLDGPENEGTVTFEQIDAAHTRVHLHMHYEPQGVVEKTGAALGGLKINVNRDLKSFKELVEMDADSGHGWRGEIVDGERVDTEFTGADSGAAPGTVFGSSSSDTFDDDSSIH